MQNNNFTTPVVFITYIRLDTTKQVFEEIRKIKPSVLYHISDAGKDEAAEARVEQVRRYIRDNIDWECDLRTNYAGVNMGCKRRIQSGLDWVFENEERAIVLEDDVVPSQSFFYFCQDMLERYKDEERVMMVTGNKRVPDYPMQSDYTFSRFCSIWGWATWRRAWKYYDSEMKNWPKSKKEKLLKNVYGVDVAMTLGREFELTYLEEINSWGYRWHFSMLNNNGLEIVPKYNLIENIGQEAIDATHKFDKIIKTVRNELKFPLTYLNEVKVDVGYDDRMKKELFHVGLAEKIARTIVPASWLKNIRKMLFK